MTRTVLITGAGGFVGSALAEAQLAAGHAVLATDLAFDSGVRARLGMAQLIEGALPDVLSELHGLTVDAVIHAAAITADPARFGLTRAGHLCANTSLLLAALEWARDHSARRFVYLSSSGVFGVAKGVAVADEHSPPTATDPYSAAKRAGEILISGADEPEFETITLRLGPVFGPHEGVRPTRPTPSLVARMFAAAREDRLISVASPQARRDWTYLPDIARAVGLLLDHPDRLPPLLHLTSGMVLTDLELAYAIARLYPETSVQTTSDALFHPPRPVMVCNLASPLDGFDWTAVLSALEKIHPTEVLT
ncbi:MAG: NAD-dependent epimerase/dehydratase family protein [Roseinatronobacter sp.]